METREQLADLSDLIREGADYARRHGLDLMAMTFALVWMARRPASPSSGEIPMHEYPH